MTDDSNQRPDQRDQRIEAALAQLGADYEPPAGWEARVLAATQGGARPRWLRFAVPAMAVAAAAVIALLVFPQRSPAEPLALRVEPQPAEKLRGPRGGSVAAVGDVAHITLTGGREPRALWIYRDDRQLLRCPGGGCPELTAARSQFDFVLPLVGSYSVVALSGDAARTEPTGTYDNDIAAARRAASSDHDIQESKLTVE